VRSAPFCDGWWKNSLFTPAGVGREAGMTGPELRFIRTEMGMTQAVKVVHHDAQSIGRWDRSEFAIDQTAEALIRLLAIEKLGLKLDGETVRELSERCVPADCYRWP
jgi:DNA-binding transcriptional regulator YiaG